MISLQTNNNIINKQVTRLSGVSTPIKILKRYYPGKEPHYLKKIFDYLLKPKNLPNLSNNFNIIASSSNSISKISNFKDQNKGIQFNNECSENTEKDKITASFPPGFNNPMPVPFVDLIKFLPLRYPRKEQLSGLKGLTNQQFNLLIENSSTGDMFRDFLNVIHHQIIFNINTLNKHKTNSYIFEKVIKNIFMSSKHIKIPHELYKIIHDVEFSIKQHLLTLYANNHDFGYELLKDICDDKIDCSSYKGFPIKINTISEAIFIKELSTKLPSTHTIKIYMPNPDNLGNLSIYYNPIDAVKQTNQKNTDCVISVELDNIKTSGKKLFYYDIKTYSVSGKSYNLAAPYVPTLTRIKQYVNDLYLTIKKLKEKNTNQILTKRYKDLFEKINTSKIILQNNKNLEEAIIIYNNMLKIALENSLSNIIEDVNISVPFNVGEDLKFDNFIDKQKFPEVNSKELGEAHQKFFPKDLILPDDNMKNIEDMIETLHGLASESYKESINKFKEITYNDY